MLLVVLASSDYKNVYSICHVTQGPLDLTGLPSTVGDKLYCYDCLLIIERGNM